MNRKRILISPNSFKECADSVTIAELLKNNLSGIKNTELIVRPISDGGDGFLNVCKFYFSGEIRIYNITAAFNDLRINCPILYCHERREIYIESAEVLGLKVVSLKYRNPLNLSSKGLGELLAKIQEDVDQGIIDVKKIFIGIGGTATIDMGIGMMSELGLELYDSSNRLLRVIPDNYLKTQRIEYTPKLFSFEIKPILDVNNSLFGKDSGILVYGKQKGADREMILQLIKSFNHLVNLFIYNKLVKSTECLSGAGGGLPASLQIFYDSPIISSQNFINKHLGLSGFLGNVDYLITGEGAYNHQSGFGKGANILMELLLPNVEKIFLVCGSINKESEAGLTDIIFPIELQRFFENPHESIANYKYGLKLACDKIKSELNF